MTSVRLLAITVLSCCPSFATPQFVFAQPIPTEELNEEWGVGGSGTCNPDQTNCTLNAGSPISLWNKHLGRYLQYGSRDYGINLVWAPRGPSPVKAVRLIRAKGTLDPISYGEPLALYVEGGKYLKYAEREYGINLVWSDTPVFEWKISGGAAETLVNSRRAVGLMNTKIGQHVVYCEREYGINLRWAKDCSRAPKAKPIATHNVHARLRLSEGDCASSGRVKFTLSPVRISARVGVYDEHSGEVSWNRPGKYNCIPAFISGLAPGRWRITATNLVDWTTECLIDLPVSEYVKTPLVDFYYRQGGCRY